MNPYDLSDPPPPEQPGVLQAAVVDPRTVCFSCGYSLAGLSPAGICPECGLPVARSLGDDSLINSAPEYLKKLHTGVVLIQTYIVGTFLAGLVAIALAFAKLPGFELLIMAASLGFLAIDILGWWMFSEPDPKLQFFPGQKPRVIIRMAVLASLAITSISFILSLSSSSYAASAAQPYKNWSSAGIWPLLAMLLGLGSLAANATKFFAAMLYLRWLAPRFPSAEIYKRSKQFMWSIPLLMTVGMLLCGLGPLIAMILYYNTLDTARRALKRIRADQPQIA